MCHIYVISIQKHLHSGFQCTIVTVQPFITETDYLTVHGALVLYIIPIYVYCFETSSNQHDDHFKEFLEKIYT